MPWMRYSYTYKVYPTYCTKANFISKWMKHPLVMLLLAFGGCFLFCLPMLLCKSLFDVTGQTFFEGMVTVFALLALVAYFVVPFLPWIAEKKGLVEKIAISEGYEPSGRVRKWKCKCGTIHPMKQTYCPCCEDWTCKCGITRSRSIEYCPFCRITRNDQLKVKFEPEVEVEEFWTCKCGITRPMNKERCPYCGMTSQK